MDISDTLAPNSDQLDAVDLRGAPPRTFTITKVDVRQKADQPVSVHLAEFPRVWRPGKSMRRVLAHCWGRDSSVWIGRRIELYCDDTVSFGGEQIGGTRISRLSNIDGPVSVPLIIGRGKSGVFRVQPLPASFKPIPESFVAKVKAGGLSSEDQAKALEYLGKLTESDPAEVAELRALLEDGASDD